MNKSIIVIVTLVVFAGNVFAFDIKFLTHSLKGQAYVDEAGELRGKEHGGKRAFNLELVRELMTLMDHQKEITEMPFKRGLMMVENDLNTALFNVSRTPERENVFKWVGPLQKEVDYFYEMKNTPTGIRTLEDAKKVDSICVLSGSIHETILRNKNFTNFQINLSYVGCFKMLKLGRVSITPKASSTALRVAGQAGISPGQIQQTPVILLESEGYIAFSKNIPDEVIQKWQDAFEKIHDSPKYQHLYDLYFRLKINTN